MEAFLLLSLAALLSFVTIASTSCNCTKGLVLCAPCSERIVDMEMNTARL
jgi:hypothetical protein